MKGLMMLFALVLLSTTPVAAESVATDSVTPVGNVERGTMVTLEGAVERILDTDEFRLSDGTGSIRVYVGPNWVPASVGETVRVTGFVDNDFFRLELYARSLTRADGTRVEFNHRYD